MADACGYIAEQGKDVTVLAERRKGNKQAGVCCGLAVSTLLLLGPATALAAEAPDAGKTLEGVKRPEVTLPKKRQAEVRVEEPARPAATSETGERFMVRGFKITGQKVFKESELRRLVADAENQEASLADLEKLAKRISDYYHDRGYIAAQAYIPAQRVTKGIVEIAVFAGRYDNIVIRKQAAISDKVVTRQLGKVKSGALIERAALEKAIWLISDLAGVEVKATLARGSKTGTCDLYLDISSREKRVYGAVSADNYGNRFTGKNQVSAAIAVLNPGGRGDLFSFYGLTAGSGLLNGNLSYALPAGGPGGKVEFGYSRLNYELGEDFASLNASGTADVFSASYSQMFKRSRTANLYGKVGVAFKKLSDTANGNTVLKRSHGAAVTLGGDSLDTWGGGGANSFSLSYVRGRLSADDANSLQAATPGTFAKWQATFTRQQYISDRLTLVSLFTGQMAMKNLDSSEKMSLGGAFGVRAYPRGEAAGDNAYILTNELRWSIPVKDRAGGVQQLIGFYDIGSARINRDPLPGSVNRRTLRGAGVGLSWVRRDDYSVKLSYAWKVGGAKAASDTDRNGRLWLAVTKHF